VDATGSDTPIKPGSRFVVEYQKSAREGRSLWYHVGGDTPGWIQESNCTSINSAQNAQGVLGGKVIKLLCSEPRNDSEADKSVLTIDLAYKTVTVEIPAQYMRLQYADGAFARVMVKGWVPGATDELDLTQLPPVHQFVVINDSTIRFGFTAKDKTVENTIDRNTGIYRISDSEQVNRCTVLPSTQQF
jgi:hypothetical protein